MTNEELRQKYRLMQLAAEQGGRSYHALDGAGHVCMVHFLPPTSPETAELLARLDALPREQTRVLERIQVDGAPVVVTELIPGFKSLAAWLQTKSARADAGLPAAPASRRVGEFTQLFGPSSGDAASPAPDQPRARPASAQPAPAAGGFTQLLGPQGTPEAASSTPAEPRPPAAPPASPAPPAGGLMQLFGSTPGTEPAPPAERPPGPSLTPPPRAESPAQPARGAGPRPGEFTQLFGAGGAGPSGPAASDADTMPLIPIDRPPDPPDPDKPNVRWRDRPATPERPVVRWKKEGVDDQPPGERPAPRPPLAPPPASPFSAPPGRPPEPPRPKAAGELTQLFGAQGAGGNDPPSPLPEPPGPATDPWGPRSGPTPFGPPTPGAGSVAPPPGITPGEFTRLFEPEKGLGVPSASALDRGPPAFFQTPSAPPIPPTSSAPPGYAAPSPPAPSGPPGEFTRLMGVGAGGVPGASGAPGDFTQMVAAVPPTPAPQASATLPPAPAEETVQRSPRLMVLIIALGLIGIAAVALVVYFALK